MGAGDFSGLTD
uniref:Uncharacterized protein n=1 Tax=Anguilla anguilla TaxID=7936 RepID=A0A0E9R1Q3_ANGAN